MRELVNAVIMSEFEHPPILEPEGLESEISDPDFCVPAEFGFKPRTREWWHKVAGNKCQFEYYDEKQGWVECGQRADHIHHILPEGWQLERGLDPEHSTGLPLCKHHHMNYEDRTFEPTEHTRNFSFHPDMGKAFKDYKYYKETQIRVYHNLGRGAARSLKSPFEEASEEHREKARRGERYWAGTEDIDRYYREKMEAKAFMYSTQTGDKKPDTSPHPYADSQRKKHWYDGLFIRDEKK